MKKLLIVLLLSQLSLWSQTAAQKYHRAKIIYNTVENFKKLEQVGLAMDHGMHKKGYSLTSDFSEAEIQIARNLGLKVEIEMEDVQQFYVDQNDKKKPQLRNIDNAGFDCVTSTIDYPTPTNFNLGTMGGYLTYEEMLQELDDMHAQFPNLITAKDNVGTFLTSEGRALQWVKITKNPESVNMRPQILYTAVHHAREPISLSETIYYMWYLLENYATNDEIKNIVDNTELYFIPVVNPDGYIYNHTTNPNGGGMWRKNRRDFGDGTFGVDNNRNYDYWINGDAGQSVWNTTGISATTDGETYPGTAPISEPETKAIQYFVENHNFKVALNAHTFSDLLLYPYGYEVNVPSPDNDYFVKISSVMVSNNNLSNIIASELYAASGDSDDFMYGQTMNHNKIFAFTPEIGESFWPASDDILPLCKKMMFTNITAAKLLREYGSLKDNSPQFIGNTAIFSANFELTKLGLGGNGNFTVSINPVSANIVSVGPPFTVSGLQVSDSVNASIAIGLASGTASNDEIIFDYVIDNGQTIETQRIIKRFGQLQNIISDTGSALLPTWTTTNWGLATGAFVSPPTSIADSPNGNYTNSQNKRITLTNPINLVGLTNATVSFAAKWNFETGYDFVAFEVSTDNGVTWTEQCGKYTKIYTPNATEGTIPAYSGTQENWVNEEINLSDYAGQTIKVRFRLSTDVGTNLDGFYFDDFKVNLLQNSVLATTNNVVSPFSIYPNPTNAVLNISTTHNDYSIRIFNLVGQLVYSSKNNDGFQNLDIKTLTSGLYFVELKSNGFVETQKFYKN
ncbi:M14 family zinc carboxypeptidase [Flavobacterium sp.]|uniref:M14 family zinc carboxypeptidase n=1 Tax=Flavobacterium sp. TaxID=239 RepID=UPI00260C6D2E|nr:M14 family zinc carboxypeptidase [Flavobacterium sp.]